jgi:hypothetical protein
MRKDALESVELDDKYVKGYLSLGEAMVELGKFEASIDMIDKGIAKIRKAFSLCSSNKTRQFEAELNS